MKTLIVVLTLLSADVDFLGNIYPAECHDLSDIALPLKESSQAELRQALGKAVIKGSTIYGVWTPKRILLKRAMPEPLRSYVIKHEKCHERVYRLTGSPKWH